ncbi:phosphopantetheine-binding protein, partial [Nonomuraea sp. NPDC050394]|uniref:non-ribosomal peptide synthetase n=1 Tax=Nonomuraea sp. NPDC050394 TaxID=3364363 RepID=UPI0037A21B72
GRPLANQCFRVVDSAGRDCPDWVPGELWIGGAGVAKGYRGDPETTGAKFTGGWYRTGDMGRYWPDGTLEFLGRLDHQVKIRGHRIELGEIETALLTHPHVERAVATKIDRHLAAFVVPAGGPGDLGDLDDLRDRLADRLPSYAVPATITPLDDLPLGANGKVDRAALARLAREPDGQSGDAPPTGPTEQALAAIWRSLLDLQDVGRHQNFVTLGGDSVLATRLAEEIRIEFGVDLPLRELFAGPTIAEHAALIDHRDDSAFEEGSL